jgi:hypothetical protein
MLDDPAHSRQWVARRLQRALTVERWAAPARAGLARRDQDRVLAAQARASQDRAVQLQALIRDVGSVPYPSHGVGAPLARAAARLLAALSRRLAARLARRIAEHTLAEYRALQAFVEDAPGVPEGLAARVAPLQQQALTELQQLDGAAAPRAEQR